jgi:hypothetical protein
LQFSFYGNLYGMFINALLLWVHYEASNGLVIVQAAKLMRLLSVNLIVFNAMFSACLHRHWQPGWALQKRAQNSEPQQGDYPM